MSCEPSRMDKSSMIRALIYQANCSQSLKECMIDFIMCTVQELEKRDNIYKLAINALKDRNNIINEQKDTIYEYYLTIDYLRAKVNSKSKFIRKCLKKIDTQEKQSELEEQIRQLKATNELLVAQSPQVYDYVAIKKRNSKLNREFLRIVKLFKRPT